jgi:hypothetical protein
MTDASIGRDHLLPLEEGWGVWRWINLRSAGFPAKDVLVLACPRAAAAFDACEPLERCLDQKRRAALEACRAARTDDAVQKKKLRKVARAVAQGAFPPEPGLAEVDTSLRALRDAAAELEVKRRAARALFEEESIAVGQALREVARRPLFREAILWQNRAALHRGVEALLSRAADATDKATRRAELLVTNYLQRYTTRNDTIGFFGPDGTWARASPGAAPFTFEHGPDLLASRTVFLTHWAVDALAGRLAQLPGMRQHLAPWRLPSIRLEGSVVHAGGKRRRVSPEDALVLARCDGVQSAAQIALALIREHGDLFEEPDDVYEILELLDEADLVIWTLEVPVFDPFPERLLERELMRLPDVPAKHTALARLGSLVRSRDRLAASAKDPAKLDGAIADIEETFSALTGMDSVRDEGRTYAARTIFYEDCARDVRCTIGPAFFDPVRVPLRLVLQSARWYTFQIGVGYHARFMEVFRELRGSTAEPIELSRFWSAVVSDFENLRGPPPIVRGAREALRERWGRLIELPRDTARIELTSRELARGVDLLFAAPCPGWPLARFHAPDLMIAAADPEAVARGDSLVVLGEVNVALNPHFAQVAIAQHPDPDDLYRTLALDMPETTLTPVEAKANYSRVSHLPWKNTDPHLELGTARSPHERSRVLAIADLIVEEQGGTLWVETRTRDARFHVMVALQQQLTLVSCTTFQPLPALPHLPRVTAGGLVINRERWRFDPQRLSFLAGRDRADRFEAARRFARTHRIPRFAFYRVPEEIKPCLLDFESPTSIDSFAVNARQASDLWIAEMLPDVGGCWLRDREGRRYTSELRMPVVDPEPWRADLFVMR